VGHRGERAAINYQHEAQGADLAITSAIDAHIEAAKPGQDQAPTARKCGPASAAPPLNPTGAIGTRGTHGRVLSRVCRAKHGRAEGAP
jgi:hypothetical protein